MSREVREIPALAERLVAAPGRVADAARRIRSFNPRFVVICGRGSSSHVGIYLRYLLEVRAGLLVSFSAPSVLTAYHRAPDMHGVLFVVISQSGKSPDLIAATEQAHRSGALTIAIVNDAASPVAAVADLVIAIGAGPERSVAATKTVALSMLQCGLLVAHLAEDGPLSNALSRLPQRLDAALSCDWAAWGHCLRDARAAFVVARGYQLGSAKEIALKMIETLQLPALAYSAAEFRHGPIAAAADDTPVLALSSPEPASAIVDDIVKELNRRRQPAFAVGGSEANLPWLADADSASEAIARLLPPYIAIERAAQLRGLDPDKPPGLVKVTETY
jgi:glutamine---fructose-6-phosphate transaminase (isomerizing)